MCETAFPKIKSGLLDAAKLSHIVSSKELCLVSDASSTAISSVLQQKIDGQ